MKHPWSLLKRSTISTLFSSERIQRETLHFDRTFCWFDKTVDETMQHTHTLECEWRNVWNPIIPSRHQYDTDAPTEHFVETAWLQSRKDFDMSESPNVLPEGTTTPSSSVTSTAGSGKILLHALTEILCFTLPRSKWKGLTTVARWNKACILRKLSGILRSVNYFVGKLGNSGFEIWPKNHSDGWSSYSNINLKIQNSHFKRDFLSPPP